MKSRDGRTVLRQNYEAMYATEYTKHKNLHLTNEKLMGKTAIEKAGDLIHIILLGLAKNLPPYTEKNKLHRLLGALFTNELTADEKISIIESEYNIEAKNELRGCEESERIRRKPCGKCGRRSMGTEQN